MRGLRTVLVVVAVVAAACAGNDDDDRVAGLDSPTTPTTTTTTTTTDGDDEGASPEPTEPSLHEVALSLELVGQFDEPIAWATHPDGTSVVGEKNGRVRDLVTGDVALDLTALVTDAANEQGLLGLAFDGEGHHLYVSYSDAATGGDSVIAEYPWPPTGAESGRQLLHVPQPFGNHNGGDIHIGPDGYLYIGLGDGGGAGDPRKHGQDTTTLLGAILRIDPTSSDDARPYGVPDDNPFLRQASGEEIYLYGVRNPWRFSFDPVTGDLWVADVGQNAWEEITVLPAELGSGRGANLGWSAMEGSHPFDGPEPDDHVGPVYEYPNPEGGCSITGGHVYRGAAIPGLAGAYLFADYCRNDIQAIWVTDGAVVDHAVYPVDVARPVSFGVDGDGELVVLSQGGGVYRLTER